MKSGRRTETHHRRRSDGGCRWGRRGKKPRPILSPAPISFEIDGDSQRCGQPWVASFLESDAVGFDVRPGRDGQGLAVGPGDGHGTGEVDERCVEPEDDLVLMLGFEGDRVVFDRGLDAPRIRGMRGFDPVEVLEDIVRLGPDDPRRVWFSRTGLEHLGELVEVGNLVADAGLPLEVAGITAVAFSPGLNLPLKLQASLGAPVGGVALADHEGEADIAQVLTPRLARSGGRGRGVDGREPVGHLGADHERTVAAVRGAQGVNLVGVDVSQDHELTDQALDERADRVVIETVPGVVGSTQREVDIAAGLGMVLVAPEHSSPLLIVERRPARCRRRASR